VTEMTVEERAELEALRARVTQLEAERAEEIARASAAVAAAQERTYWLDRWHVDLNALMQRPGAAQVRAVLSLASKVARRLLKIWRRLLG
jgi:hypothetical protein